MHEYALFSHIPASREKQVLNILAGVTATQPVPICEQTVIYAQTRVPDAPASKKTPKQQQARQVPVPSYHKLLRDVHLEGDHIASTDDWRFRVEQVPDPGVTTLISRAVTEQLATDEHKAGFRDASWYRYQHQFTLIGHRFVLDNVIIRIARYYVPLHPPLTDPVDAPPYAPKDLKLLDESGSWVVECIIRVEDASISAISDKAKAELLRFQSRMDGAVDLYTPDRLALDNRVRAP